MESNATHNKICPALIGRWCKKTVFAWLSVVLILVILALIFIIWVATGPRSLKDFAPQISSQINQQLPNYQVELGDIVLSWDHWQSPLDARFQEVHIRTQAGQMVSKLEYVDVSLDPLKFLTGSIALDEVTLHEPTINIYRKTDGEFILDLGHNQQYGPDLPPEMLDTSPKPLSYHLDKAGTPNLLGLERINIRGGKINLGDTRRGIIAQLADVDLSTLIEGEQILLRLNSNMRLLGREPSPISFSSTIPKNSFAISSDITFKQLYLPLFAELDDTLGELENLQLSADGNISFSLNQNATLRQMRYDLKLSKGRVISDMFKDIVDVESAKLSGYMPSENILVIENSKLDLAGASFTGGAKLAFGEQGVQSVEADIVLAETPIEMVDRYWPINQSPVSRQWVTSNLSGGKATQATLKLNLTKEALAQDRLPDESVDAVINFEDLTVKFMPDFEPLSNAQGVISINANQLTADISSANYLQATNVSKGRVLIDDLSSDNPTIEIGFDVDAPAKEVAQILSVPSLAIAQEVGMKPEEITGQVTGSAQLNFPFTLPRNADGTVADNAYDYSTDLTLKNITQMELFGEYDISGANGSLKVTPEKVDFNGSATLFDKLLNLTIAHALKPKTDELTDIKASGDVDTDFLEEIGVELDEWVDGTIGLNANILLKKADVTLVNAKAALTQAALNVKQLGWEKEVGTQANIEVVAENHPEYTDLSSLNFVSGNDVFDGSIRINELGKLERITATKLALGNNQLQLSYAPIAGGYKIYAQGDYFDASGFFEDKEEEDEPISFKKIPALDLKLDLKKLVLDEGRTIENLTGHASCTPLICEHVEVSGKIQGSKPLLMKIERSNGKRLLNITSEDAGGILSGLNIYDNMEGGRLNIAGEFDDGDPDRPLIGNIHIWDFQVSNTPVLARIVTLASFGGLIDAITGSGLSFSKLKSKYTLRNDVITLDGFRSTGDSIGITADGVVDLQQELLKLKGVVIPSYTINSFLKNVPLVGDILTGGEAIIAANYTVEGSMEEPEVSVNPLSALAPGFLRKIFE